MRLSRGSFTRIAQWMVHRDEFLLQYAPVKASLLSAVDGVLAPAKFPEMRDWLSRMLDYNVPRGKLNRGLLLVNAFRALGGGGAAAPSTAVDVSLKNAFVLAWCVEIMQAFFLISDDIMDASLTRRGTPCWYTVRDVGLRALNDAFLLESAVELLLRRSLLDGNATAANGTAQHGRHLCALCTEEFRSAKLVTVLGQYVDVLPPSSGDILVPSASQSSARAAADRYARLVELKTAHYSFYLPLALAFHLAGVDDAAMFEAARKLAYRMGFYFQAQDDYLDVWGDPTITGKVGTDIQDRKCTWLLCRALELLESADEVAILRTHYGKANEHSVNEVRKLYERLGLREAFSAFQSSERDALRGGIERETALPDVVRQLLVDVLAEMSMRVA